MKKIFFINLLVAILFIAALFFLHLIVLRTTSSYRFKTKYAVLSQAVLVDLQNILAQSPPSKWNDILRKMNTNYETSFTIVNINQLHLSAQHRQRLMSFFVVGNSKAETKYTQTGLQSWLKTTPLITLMQRIGKTSYILKIDTKNFWLRILPVSPTLIYQLVHHMLMLTPIKDWPATIKQLEQQFHFPFKLLNLTQQTMPYIKNTFKTTNIAYEKMPQEFSHIRKFYIRTPNPSVIIQIGPIHYPYTWMIEQMYLVIFTLLFLVFIAFSMISSLAYGRNINKIFQITKRYGHADFDHDPSFSRLSILYSVYQNIKSMGMNYKKLLQFRLNMSRFIAHEARTPLTTMKFSLDHLAKNTQLPANALPHVNNLKSDINSLNQLVSSFLLYSQSQANQLQPHMQLVNLADWLQNCLTRYYGANIKPVLHIEIKPKVSRIMIDPFLLQHVIDNLLTNALKFARHRIDITLKASKESLMLYIDDDGQGIVEGQESDIFDAFVTLKTLDSQHQHVGLGLNIAKNIIALHKGAILATTAPLLGGARFIVTLPKTSRPSNPTSL